VRIGTVIVRTLVLLALVPGVGVAQADASGGTTASEDTLVVSGDPELRRISAALLPSLAARSGLELRAPVRVERRSRADLEAYVIGKLDEELPPGRARLLADAYALLGLAPTDFDLRATLTAIYTEQVAGFYEPDSTALYVLDDQPSAALESLLMHELVHAVQDQWVDLAAVTAPGLDNDRSSAAQAAIEGHAMLVMLEHAMSSAQPDLDVVDIPRLAGLLRPLLDGVREEYPALGAAPRIVQESLLLPYTEGAAYVQAVWAERGRRVPLGDMLPASTEQVAYPERFTAAAPDAPTDVGVTVSGDVEVLLDDVLGFAETRVFLEELAGESAGAAAGGWDGDRWALVRDDERRGVVWALVFDTDGARDRFAATVTPHLTALPDRSSLRTMRVDGRPVALLRIGLEPEVTVTLEGGVESGEELR